jgi:hypothetical protein
MEYYTPTNQVRLSCDISDDDYLDLKRFLAEQPEVENVATKVRTTDSLPDPNVVEVTYHVYVCLVHLAKASVPFTVPTASALVVKLVSNWIDKRNESKKAQIAEGKDASILYDASGNIIKLSKNR